MSSVVHSARRQATLTSAKISVFAGQCGLIAMGSYYAQPLELNIASEIGLAPHLAGLVVTVSQIGYVAGLLLIAPLGDVVENRRLVLAVLAGSFLSLIGASVSHNAPSFLAASFGIGLFSVAVQMLVAFAGTMADEATRGSAVGWVTGGLLVGILAAWPVANMTGPVLGWRALYLLQGLAIAGSVVVMARMLPRRMPLRKASYTGLVATFWQPFAASFELRRRAVAQAALFGCFSLFWTAAPLKLAQYHLGRTELALFGLVGGIGTLIAPLAGRAADQGREPLVRKGGIAIIAAGFLLCLVIDTPPLLCLCAILLGAGVQANLVASQRRILSMDEHGGQRLNGLFVAIFFLGGAMGSAVAAPLFSFDGWAAISLAALASTAFAAVFTLRPSVSTV